MTKKVLLVDDDEDIQLTIKTVLNKSGFEVASAYDGTEALRKIPETKPDLIILDLLMPGKNGVEVYEELKTNPEFAEFGELPVIMLTACDHSETEIRRLIQLGLTAYLEKPFGHKELLNVIHNAFLINEDRVRNVHLRWAAQKSKDFLESLVSCSPVVIVTADADDRVSFMNRAGETLFQTSLRETLGAPVTSVLQLEREQYEQIKRQLGAQLHPVTAELTVRSSSGRRVPMRLTFSLLRDNQDKISGYLVVGLDLTDQKALERERLEKERLRAIMESLATINHQINNPLTPILGNLQLLQNEKEQLPAPAQKKIDTIEANARRIFEIIQEFNRVSRPVEQKYYGQTQMLDISTR